MALAVLGAMVLAACGGTGGRTAGPDRVIRVEDATVVAPAGANSAAYLTVHNDGPDGDRLVEVRSPAAARTELHETRTDDDGLLRMHHLDHLELPAGETVRLEPGGRHVMLFDVDDLTVGSTTELELVFEHGRPQTVEATVRTHAELIG